MIQVHFYNMHVNRKTMFPFGWKNYDRHCFKRRYMEIYALNVITKYQSYLIEKIQHNSPHIKQTSAISASIGPLSESYYLKHVLPIFLIRLNCGAPGVAYTLKWWFKVTWLSQPMNQSHMTVATNKQTLCTHRSNNVVTSPSMYRMINKLSFN